MERTKALRQGRRLRLRPAFDRILFPERKFLRSACLAQVLAQIHFRGAPRVESMPHRHPRLESMLLFPEHPEVEAMLSMFLTSGPSSIIGPGNYTGGELWIYDGRIPHPSSMDRETGRKGGIDAAACANADVLVFQRAEVFDPVPKVLKSHGFRSKDG